MMKKRIKLFTLMLVTAMSMQAQSLVGTWNGEPITDEDGAVTTWSFIFNQGSTMSCKFKLEMKDADVGRFVFLVDVPGTYKRSGNELTLNLNPQKAEGKVVEMDPTGELAQVLKEHPEMKKTVNEMIYNQFSDALKKSLSDQMPLDGDATIVKLTASELVLNDGDDDMRFTRGR